MPRDFIIATQDEIDLRIAEAIHAREMEIAGYDFEQAGHEATLARLADVGEWSRDDQHLRGLAREQLILTAKASSVDLANIADRTLRDQAALQLEAVKIELRRSEEHYANLLEQLPAGERRTKAIAALRAKQQAEASEQKAQ